MNSKNLWVKAFVDTSLGNYKNPIIDVTLLDKSDHEPKPVKKRPPTKKIPISLVSEKDYPLTIAELTHFFGEKDAKKFFSELIRVGYVITYQLVDNDQINLGDGQYIKVYNNWLNKVLFDVEELTYLYYELEHDYDSKTIDKFCELVFNDMLSLTMPYLVHQREIRKSLANFITKN